MITHEYIIQVSKSRDTYFLVYLADLHNGTKNFDEDRCKKLISWIAAKPWAYWIGGGDYCEAITVKDKRFDPNAIHPKYIDKLGDIITAEYNDVRDLLKPIAGKCIGLHLGNHEDTIYREYSRDIVNELCEDLSTTNLGASAMTRLKFMEGKKEIYSCVVHSEHGHMSGRKPGGKVNSIEDKSKYFNADIFFEGHSHDKICHSNILLSLAPKVTGGPRDLVATKRVFGITGSFFRTYQVGAESYAEKKGYPPSTLGVVRVSIDPYKGDIHISQ